MSRFHQLAVITLSLWLLAGIARPAAATTFVRIPDQRLAAEAAVIVDATVLSRDPSPGQDRPVTDYVLQVGRVLRGSLSGSSVAVRVPGGGAAGEAGLEVWGAPSFRDGERVLLFLLPNADGSYRLLHLMLGAFHEVSWGGRRLAVRDLSQTAELVEAAGGQWRLQPAGEAPRDWQRFTSWLAALAGRAEGAGQPAGEREDGRADYRVELPPAELGQIEALAAAGHLVAPLQPPAQAEIAWFANLAIPGSPARQAAPAASAPSAISAASPALVPPASAATLTPVDTDRALAEAAAVAVASLAGAPELHAAAAPPLTYGGTTTSLAGLDRFEGQSTVLFGNQGFDGDLPAFDCASGGLVSLSGSWFDRDRQVQGGSVVVAAGLGCLFADAAGATASGLQAILDHDLPPALLGARAPRGSPAQLNGGSQAKGSSASGVSPANGGSQATGVSPARGGSPAPGASPASDGFQPADVAQAGEPSAAPLKAAAGGAASSQPLAAASSAPAGRGYHARACGFDLNHNGVFGEAADCHVCDGVTTNPYNDSTPPNLVYVSCQTGADNASCGSPGTPCATINYAWNNRTGPASSPSADIICFRGTCHEDGISTSASGKGGSYTIPASGSEAISWQLPTHPTMLVGWDYNHNGQYPPYDTADEAVLEGTGLAQALKLNGNQINSNVELAHFTVSNYGTGVNANPTGFIELSDGAYGTSSHIYIHDISIQNVNRGKALDSGNIIFDFFGSNAQINYLAVENVEIVNVGGYVARGAASTGGPENGPYRFQNLSVTALGCNATGPGACPDPADQSHVVGFKLWGYVSQIEVLDSAFYLNTTAWIPYPTAFGSTAFFAAQCSRNWTIRNNEIDDFKVGLVVQGYAAGYCDGPLARTVDAVTFDRNTFRNTYTQWLWSDNGVQILGGGPNPQSSIGTVLVSNNFFSSAPGWQGMAYVSAGNNGGPDPGNLIFANNTTVSNLYRAGFGAITLQKNYNFVPQAITVKNNVIGGLASGEENIHTDYAPAAWAATANVFDPNGVFSWNGNSLGSLTSWQQATGQDATARQCRPSFVNASSGDFHLVSSDSCAKGRGSLLTSLFTWDIDGSPRPLASAWDTGAHEVSAAPPPVALRFYTVAPCRVLDTRTLGAPLTPNNPAVFPVGGTCGIPGTAAAVSFNVTAVSATAKVGLQVYPGDQLGTGTNVVSADTVVQTRAAAAVIALAGNGTGTVGVLPTFQTQGQVHLLLDVNGYFAP